MKMGLDLAIRWHSVNKKQRAIVMQKEILKERLM
jgi:hypothetical protein